MNNLILFAAQTQEVVEDSMMSRFLVFLGCAAAGAFFIWTGRNNIKTKTAEESGKRRGINTLLGRSNTYEGDSAVAIGWLRVGCGVAAIIFGIVFLFVGPFLADKPKVKRNAQTIPATVNSLRA